MGRRTFACALAALAAAAGCGERAEPVGELAQEYPVSVRGAADEPAVADRSPRRIVALDPGSAELVAALGAARRLVGVPAGVDGTDATEVVTPAGHVRVDGVVRLEPDLIVGTPGVDPLDVARSARESGAVSYVQPAASVAEVQRGTIELGFLLGKAPEARRLVGDMRSQIGKVEDRIAGRAAVPVFVDTGFLITVSDRSLLGDLVRRAGGRNVAGPNPGGEAFEPCAVVQLGAQIVLEVSEPRQRTPLSAFAACPRGQRVRIARVPPELALRAGPRLPEALERIARALHPDAFG